MPDAQQLPSVADVPVRALPPIRGFVGVRSNANPMALALQEAVYARNLMADEQGVLRRRLGYFKLNTNDDAAAVNLPGKPVNVHRFYKRDGTTQTLAWCSDSGAGDLRKYNGTTKVFDAVTNDDGPMQYTDGAMIHKAQINDVVFYTGYTSTVNDLLFHYSGKTPTAGDTTAGGVVLASGLPIPQETYSAADGAVGPPAVDDAEGPYYVVVFVRTDTNRGLSIVSDPTDPFSPATHDVADTVDLTLPAVDNTGAVYGSTALFDQTFYKYDPAGVDILITRSVYRLASDGQYRLVVAGLDLLAYDGTAPPNHSKVNDALTGTVLLDKDALHNGDFGDGASTRILARGHGRPPSGAKALFTHKNMLFMLNAVDWLGGVTGTRRKKTAFWAVPAFPEYFPEENQWDFRASDDGDELIAGASSEDGVVVLAHNHSYFMATFQFDNLQAGAESVEISNQYGCQAPRSLAQVNGTWFWLSHAGVVAYQVGTRYAVLMRNDVTNLLDNLTLTERMDAVGTHEGDYYVLTFPDARGTALVYNTRTDRWLPWDNLPRVATAYLDSRTEGDQYLWADNRQQERITTIVGPPQNRDLDWHPAGYWAIQSPVWTPDEVSYFIHLSGGDVDDIYSTTFEWRSGYLDFGMPLIRKIIRKFQAVLVCSRDVTITLGAEVKGFAWAWTVPATTSPWSWGGYFWWRDPTGETAEQLAARPYWSSRSGLQITDKETPMELQGERLWWGFSVTSRVSSPVSVLKFHELVLLGQLVPSGR